ncbi:Hypothetical protein SMAX5B_002154 [Scophthalmus maximus]|uniref:Uncharacterized protein n=1 Tax=Scophthalmus maximus TaxID=52904 RepID=A0A2U9AV44_SCOMX|nr:Hypothetical protein SMAX5B_002154 [Scophthalmus maximus]
MGMRDDLLLLLCELNSELLMNIHGGGGALVSGGGARCGSVGRSDPAAAPA